MRPIQMVDLKTQYQKLKPQIDKAVIDVLESAAFIGGKPVATFAENLGNYLGIKHVIPCANGTDALQIALMALDLQPGDEVITPSFTFIATTEVVALLKIKPVFVDVDKDTFCMDIDAVKKAITPKTKAIVPVHLYGQATDMEPLMALAKAHNIAVIEDNAQAIGCDYTFSDGSVKKTGTIGDIGTTSFFPSKNLGGYGDGGAICTDSDTLAAKMRIIASHGSAKRYYHEVVGVNSRLDTIQAAILDIKLPHLDEYIAARNQAADYYDKAFAGHPKIKTPVRSDKSNHVFHQYTLILEGVDRDGLQAYLSTQQIPAMIYYPVPGHRQQMFAAFETDYDLPVTDYLTSRVISLPIHTELDEQQLAHITSHVLEFCNR
ncbi:DegT/DnrJ/EryC1/StrS family aminotransferase [Arachidicoccus ginsenosidivorans]|uniref:DegT/DnrJ/EryC1/StrS family aminotransferase n=1 Tax=Arachidicoccus ginsenosidivorans TaxID=496057 RepID=A0A5B8VNN6_9BACT|nr:DegT/DnrJ/EryC1/StrS family aminotransferase [Arachidicoccus ginsenosidivorans]QEC72823.1 DegT/DnrJ/EryC1/StrS family aminotransferase [Arachidicoccus ginsenosidivorans]